MKNLAILLISCVLLGCEKRSQDKNTAFFLITSNCEEFVLKEATKTSMDVRFDKITHSHVLYEDADVLGIMQYDYYDQALEFINKVNSYCFGNTFVKIPKNQLMKTSMNLIYSQDEKIEGVRFSNGDLEVYIKK